MTKKVTYDESKRARRGVASVSVRADPITIETDTAELVAGPAKEMARALERGIRGVSATAAPSTLRRRRQQGISSTRRWNATGTLASSVRAEKSGQAYVVTMSDDRLQDPALLERLAQDVREMDEVPPEVDAVVGDAITVSKRSR